MEIEKNWSELSWQEKREKRFERWLSPPEVKFINKEAERLYKARVTRFIKALKLEEPDRVPVNLPMGNFPAFHAGLNINVIMYDYPAMKKAWIKFMDDFGDMDQFNAPGLIPSGKVTEALRSRVSLWPGLGLPVDAPMNQSVEGEYMKAEEYKHFLLDPSDFALRVLLPRHVGLFDSFQKLPPLRGLQGANWVAVLTDPEIRKTFQTLLDLGDEYETWRKAYADIAKLILTRGYPSVRGSPIMAGAPFDHFADLLRGTRGISMDLRRQPEVLQQAMDRWEQITIDQIRGLGMTSCPVVLMPLHKGDDTFMSDKQFETFYWPGLRRVMMAMVEEGFVPMPFAEGRYNKRLRQIADTPKSAIAWYFDQTDMAEAKKVLGNICCLMGNVPTSVIIKGTPQEVKSYCRKVIETCAPGGGYILCGGASVEKTTVPNLKAMMESAYEYGIYK
jgi:hypothetical protein